MISFNTDILFIDLSGQIRVLNNSLTLRPSSSGNIIIGVSGSALVPEFTDHQFLGLDYLRWGNIFAVSGNFTNRPTVNGVTVALTTDTGTGGGGGLPVDARPVSGHIIPNSSGVYDLGSEALPFKHLYAQSGVFSDRIQLIPKIFHPSNQSENGQIWYKSELNVSEQFPRLMYVTPSGIRTVKTVEGYAFYYAREQARTLQEGDGFLTYAFDTIVSEDSRYFTRQNANEEVTVWLSGLYKVSYKVLVDKTTNASISTLQGRAFMQTDPTQLIEQSIAYGTTNNTTTGDRTTIAKTFYCFMNAGQRISIGLGFVGGVGTYTFAPFGSLELEFVKLSNSPSGVY